MCMDPDSRELLRLTAGVNLLVEEIRPGSAAASSDLHAGYLPTDLSGVELDTDQLSPSALRGLVEEYVSREGTDYGPGDWTLEDKVAQVLRQLERGEARIVFNFELESASIVAVRDRPIRPRTEKR